MNCRRAPAAVLVTVTAVAAQMHAQQRSSGAPTTPVVQHLIIPSLANATKPSDLDFEAGECDISPAGTTMDCQFQQVFLTTALFDANICLITTNRYERRFEKQNDGSWLSSEGPTGDCGIVDVAVLRREGEGARWTMELRKAPSRREAPACRDLMAENEVLSWQNVRRPLPCRFVQPGAMSQ